MREPGDLLQHLLSSSPSVLYSLSADDFATTWVSPNIVTLMGYTEAEARAPRWWPERVHPEDWNQLQSQTSRLLEVDHVAREYRFRHKSGEYRWVRDEQRLLRDGPGRPVEIVGSWSDVTARKDAEGRLRQSEEQYRLLFDSNPHPMWVHDADTLTFLAVNDAAVRHYGWSREEFLGMTIMDVSPNEDIAQAPSEGSAPASAAGSHLKRDGTVVQVETVASPIIFQGQRAWLTLATDVTEKVRLEARLVQSQKMEAVGQLAGGIAHDFNNLLGIIVGAAGLLMDQIGSDHPATMRVDQIASAAARAAALTRQLLAFSRRQVLQPTVIDVNEALRDVEGMLRRLIGEDIEFVTRLGAEVGHVKVDQGQLDQVIINLVVNARDAMPKGGTLIMETSNAELDAAYARVNPDVAPGPYVLLAISDTGHGMTAQTRARVFEPFFTTKAAGRGTGLGLATVYGIVKQSDGHIAVYSEPGHGTTFKVFLPRVEDALTTPATPEPRAVGGTETLLVVEDADGLRAIVGEVLEAGGYTALTAASPDEALELARKHPGPIHCLLTDVIMPHMSGRELADRLQSELADLRVLFMSGYADEAVGHHGILAAGIPFIQKPFTSVALLQSIRRVLDTPPQLGTSE